MRQDPVPLTTSRASPTARGQVRRPVYFACKRVLDLTVSLILLILLLPLMMVIALLIVLDSPGPAIFRQKRVGPKQQIQDSDTVAQCSTFDMYKFRTMYVDANSDIHRAFVQAFIRNDQESMAQLQNGNTEVRKLVDDPRVTPLGRFLRKSSLDELPQFWNVVKGDMSLVGPRPSIPYELEAYKPWHYRRLVAKPGVTGLWQVTARSCVDFDEMVELDLDYVENQSFWLDLKILLKTPWTVLSGKGAV